MSKYIGCDCGSEVLRIEYDDETKEFYIGVYQLIKQYSWRDKLHYIWQILRKGEPYGDQICLRKNSALELKEYIELHTRKGKVIINE